MTTTTRKLHPKRGTKTETAARAPSARTPKHLTIKQFADYFEMSVSGVHKAIEAGKLTCVKVPGTGTKTQRRIPYTEVTRIESGK